MDVQEGEDWCGPNKSETVFSSTCSSYSPAQAYNPIDGVLQESHLCQNVIYGRPSKNELDCVQSGSPDSSWVASVEQYRLYYDPAKWPIQICV